MQYKLITDTSYRHSKKHKFELCSNHKSSRRRKMAFNVGGGSGNSLQRGIFKSSCAKEKTAFKKNRERLVHDKIRAGRLHEKTDAPRTSAERGYSIS